MVQEEVAALKAQKPDVLQQTDDAESVEAVKSLPASIATSTQQPDDYVPADGKPPAQDKAPSIQKSADLPADGKPPAHYKAPSVQKSADVPARDMRQHHSIPEEDDEQNRMVRPFCRCQGKYQTIRRRVEV